MQGKKPEKYEEQKILCTNHPSPVEMRFVKDKLTFTLNTKLIYICPKCGGKKKIILPHKLINLM